MKIKPRSIYFVVFSVVILGVFITLILSNFVRIEITRTETNQLVHFNDPLFYSLMNNESLAAIESILISHGYDLDKLNMPVLGEEGFSYLHLAVRNGHTDIVELLIKYGANPDGNSSGQRTSPLFSAILQNDTDMVVLLLASGASPTVLMNDTSAIALSVYNDASEDIKNILSQHSQYAKYMMNHFHVIKNGEPFSHDVKAPETNTKTAVPIRQR